MKRKAKSSRQKSVDPRPGALTSRDSRKAADSITFILDALSATGSPADTRARAALVKARASLPAVARR